MDAAGGTSHGYLSQDGRAPGEIASDARVASTAISAKRLIIATGVRDELPPAPGLAERWGRTVFHCPYCHGYEMDAGRIGIIAASPLAQHHALMLPD